MEYERNPWGEERGDWRSAMLASVVANRHRGKREPQYKPADFIPEYGPKQPRKQTPQQMLNIFRQITHAVNATQKAS